MQEEIEEFNQTLLNLYFNNLNFLKETHPQIFEKVNKLSDNIEKGIHKEKYSLEYKTEGYFDILNIESNEFIYGFNSYDEADKRANITNFTRHHSLDLLRVEPTTNKFALMGSHGATVHLVDYLNKKIDFENITFSKIYKYIFIGVGVGVHIHEIYKKIDSMNTLIIEPSTELFRLSLFTTDYSIFEQGNKKLFLSIGETEVQREHTLSTFTAYHSYMNYNIKHHLFWIDYEYILDEIIGFYSHNHAGAFSFNSILQVFSRTLEFMHEKENFLQKSLIEEHTPLKNKKVLLISGGPSVDNHIDWIYENQDKFIIICVDVILKKLEKHKVIPDIVVSIDPSHLVAEFFKTEDENFLENSAIIFLSQQDETVLNTVKHLNVYFSQVYYISKKIGYAMSLANVGTFSLAMGLLLDANELYLIGSDAAFEQETGNRYAKDSGHTHVDEHKESEKNENEKNTISFTDVIEVKGNLTDTVKTNRDLFTFKKDYEAFLHTVVNEKEFKAYNLSDGAYIEGLIPLNIEDINIEDSQRKEFNIKEVIDSISINDIDDIDFEDDIKIINRIIKKVTKYKKVKISSKNNFLESKLDIMIWILEQNKIMSSGIFGNIFLKYIELIDIYINFTLNLEQRELNTPKNLAQIRDYWCDSLVDLLKNIKKAVSK